MVTASHSHRKKEEQGNKKSMGEKDKSRIEVKRSKFSAQKNRARKTGTKIVSTPTCFSGKRMMVKDDKNMTRGRHSLRKVQLDRRQGQVLLKKKVSSSANSSISTSTNLRSVLLSMLECWSWQPTTLLLFLCPLDWVTSSQFCFATTAVRLSAWTSCWGRAGN